MRALLVKASLDTSKCHYFFNGKRKEGVHEDISGNVSDIRGDVSDISGDVSDISGDVSGICGDVSDISGDVDECEITSKEREKGINIEDLVKKD